jgi:hypothetical protein
MMRYLGSLVWLWVIFVPASAWSGEIAVLTNENWERLAPAGKEADCILGDYVLKSDRVWAVVAQPAAWRNANMTVRQVGGAVIDLTTVDRSNDQLSAFYPGMRRNPFDKAEIVESKGRKVILALIAPAQEAKPAVPERRLVPIQAAQPAVSRQPEVRLTYELEDGQPYLLVRSVFKNTWEEPLEFLPEDDLRADNFDSKARNGPHELFWVHDRYFEQAYGVVAEKHRIKSTSDATRLSRLEYLPGQTESAKITLKPGATHELVRRLIPAPNLLALKGLALPSEQSRKQVDLIVVDERSSPVARADIALTAGGEDYGSGRTDERGVLRTLLPAGEYEGTVRSIGRGSFGFDLSLAAATPETRSFKLRLPVASTILGDVTDERGNSIPCKVQFKGMNGTIHPNWGPTAAREAVVNLYYSHTGKFTVPINPGEYEAIVSYGPEYDVARVPLVVERGAAVPLKAVLKRSVHSPGWVSTDFHSHASPSGDNTSDQRGRVLNLLCEHIEFAPCTEHNRLDTYVPHLRALGMERLMGTCTGIELTGQPLPLNHQNAFPLRLKPRTQDNGAPQTDPQPETQIRRLFEWDDKAEMLIQQNHPDIGWLFFDKDGDGEPDNGYQEGFAFMHVIEVHPIHQILEMKSTRNYVTQQGRREWRNETIFNWLQLLNQGHRIPGVVNTDAHYNFHGSGGLRNWVRCDTETPGDIDPLDIVRHARKGHIIMSTGPFLEVKANGQASGGRQAAGNVGNEALPGDDLQLENGKGTLHVRVQCSNWLDIDRVQVLVNGRPEPKWNFTRRDHPERFGKDAVKFDQKIEFTLEKDAHLIVVAVGEDAEIGEVMGPMWGRQNPVAISNPIFVDVDGGGFKANGDTLEAPLPKRGGKPVN